MKKKIICLYLAILLCATLYSVSGNKIKQNKDFLQPSIEWELTYGGNKVDWGRCVQQTSEGGFIISGAFNRNTFMPWLGDVYMIKTDFMGNVEWSQTHGIYQNENVGQYIQQTSDNGYIIAGFTGWTYHIDAYILKTDSFGNIEWTNVLGDFDFYDNSLCVQQTTDDGYIITGWTGSYGSGSSDVWLIKLNITGDIEWNTTFGGVELDGGAHVKQTSDNGFIIIGETNSFDYGGNGDVWLIKTDSFGNEQWNRTYGGVFWDSGNCVVQTSDDGYILTGRTSSYGSGDSDVWLIKTDSFGNEMWNSTYGGINFDEGKSVVQTFDGGYFITGDFTDEDPVYEDMELYMVKTDQNGLEEWSYIIDHNGLSDSGSYGIQTSDGGYLVTGEYGEYMLQQVDVLLIKLQGTNTPPYIPYDPNPANGSIDVAINTDLSWYGGDPDGDNVSYDIYFGTLEDPPLIEEDHILQLYDPGLLELNTTYYWKIVSRDEYGAYSEGPIWMFKTIENSPELIFELKGGLGVNLIISNDGEEDLFDIQWEISVQGGFSGLINKTVSGSNDIPAGDSFNVGTGILFGLGGIDATANVYGVVKSEKGFQILFITLI